MILHLEADTPEKKQKAFTEACRNGQVEAVKKFLSDPDINPAYEMEQGFVAAFGCENITITLLLLADPRVNPPNHMKRRVFSWACERGDVKVVTRLLSDPSSCLGRLHYMDYEDKHILHRGFQSACYEGHVDIVNLLILDPRVDPTAESNEALISACKRGWVEVVKRILLDPSVDPTGPNDEPLIAAHENLHTDILKVLLADPRVESKYQKEEDLFTNEKGQLYGKRALKIKMFWEKALHMKSSSSSAKRQKIANMEEEEEEMGASPDSANSKS
jgi:ankyrin repeat protein